MSLCVRCHKRPRLDSRKAAPTDKKRCQYCYGKKRKRRWKRPPKKRGPKEKVGHFTISLPKPRGPVRNFRSPKLYLEVEVVADLLGYASREAAMLSIRKGLWPVLKLTRTSGGERSPYKNVVLRKDWNRFIRYLQEHGAGAITLNHKLAMLTLSEEERRQRAEAAARLLASERSD